MYAEINPTLNYNRAVPNQQTDVGNNMYDKCQQHTSNNYYNGGNSSLALRYVLDNTKVSMMYFSPENVKRIQKKIKQNVVQQSEGKFKMDIDQDEQDLILVMRAVFLEYGKNLDDHIVSQVKALNEITIKCIMPDLMTNIKQYYSYQKEIHEPLKPIVRPMNVSHAGRKTLPSVTSVWGF